MAATIITPTQYVCTTGLADAIAAVAASKVRRYDVRAANIGAADATVDLVLTNGAIVNYRAKNYPVPYNNAASAPDLENGLIIPTGWKLQAKASAGSTVELSITGVEDDA